MTDLNSTNKAIGRVGADYVDINHRWNRFTRFLESRGFAWVPVFIGLLMLVLPILSIFILCISFPIIRFITKQNVDLPLRAPMEGPQKTSNDIDTKGKKREAAGITYYGICRNSNRRVYSDSDLERQHRLIVGTTGSGKTVGIIALNVATFIFGGGQTMFDGKGDKAFIYSFMALARRFLRTPCIFTIDLATSKDIYERSTKFLSNQINLPSQGSSGVLAEITKATADDGDSDVWAQRKNMWIDLSYRLLFYYNDRHGETATMSGFVKTLDLKYFISRYLDTRLTNDTTGRITRESCTDFMSTLPGLDPNELDKIHKGTAQLTTTTLDQWGYVVMSVAPALSLITRQYWHIFDTTALSDIHFEDAFIGDRILFGLLPALQKSETSMRSLGKLLVGLMQSMYGTLMPEDLAGDFDMLKEIRATNSPYYYQVFYDEGGYYLTAGSDKQQAQLRALNVSVTVACQNIGQLAKSGEDVADGIWGSSNIKLVGKVEDSGQTFSKIKERLGQREKWVADEREIEVTSSGRTRFKGPTRIQKKTFDVVTIEQLSNQLEGEFLMIVSGDKVINLKTPYFTKKINKIRSNVYMPMRLPVVRRESNEFTQFKHALKGVLSSKLTPEDIKQYLDPNDDLCQLLGHLNKFDSENGLESGLVSIHKQIDSIYETNDGPDPSDFIMQILGQQQTSESAAVADTGGRSDKPNPDIDFSDDYYSSEDGVEKDDPSYYGFGDDDLPASNSVDSDYSTQGPIYDDEGPVECVDHSDFLGQLLKELDTEDDASDSSGGTQITLDLDPSESSHNQESPTPSILNYNLESTELVTEDDFNARDESEVSFDDVLDQEFGTDKDPLVVSAAIAGVKDKVKPIARQDSEDFQPPYEVSESDSRNFLEKVAQQIEDPDIDMDFTLPVYKKKNKKK